MGRIRSERRGPLDAVETLKKLLAYDQKVYTYQIAALRRRRNYLKGILRKQMRIAGGRELPTLQSEVEKMEALIVARQRTLAQRIDALKKVEGELDVELDKLSSFKKRDAKELEAERIIDDFIYHPLVESRLKAYRKSNQRYMLKKYGPRDST